MGAMGEALLEGLPEWFVDLLLEHAPGAVAGTCERPLDLLEMYSGVGNLSKQGWRVSRLQTRVLFRYRYFAGVVCGVWEKKH